MGWRSNSAWAGVRQAALFLRYREETPPASGPVELQAAYRRGKSAPEAPVGSGARSSCYQLWWKSGRTAGREDRGFVSFISRTLANGTKRSLDSSQVGFPGQESGCRRQGNAQPNVSRMASESRDGGPAERPDGCADVRRSTGAQEPGRRPRRGHGPAAWLATTTSWVGAVARRGPAVWSNAGAILAVIPVNLYSLPCGRVDGVGSWRRAWVDLGGIDWREDWRSVGRRREEEESSQQE